MNEQKAKEGEGETKTAPNTSDGNISSPVDKVERAEQAVKRLEETEKRIDEKIAKLAELKADAILGGTAGGHIETQISEQELKKKGAKEFWKGTQIEGAIERHG